MQRPYHVGNRAVDDMGTGLHCGFLQDAGHVWLHERVPSMRNAVAQLCRVLPCCLHHGVRRNISFWHNDGVSYILRQLATDEPVCHSADDDSLRHSIFHDEARPSSGSVPVAEGCRLHRSVPLERVPDIRHVDVHLRRALRLVDEQHYMAGHGHNAGVFYRSPVPVEVSREAVSAAVYIQVQVSAAPHAASARRWHSSGCTQAVAVDISVICAEIRLAQHNIAQLAHTLRRGGRLAAGLCHIRKVALGIQEILYCGAYAAHLLRSVDVFSHRRRHQQRGILHPAVCLWRV